MNDLGLIGVCMIFFGLLSTIPIVGLIESRKQQSQTGVE